MRRQWQGKYVTVTSCSVPEVGWYNLSLTFRSHLSNTSIVVNNEHEPIRQIFSCFSSLASYVYITIWMRLLYILRIFPSNISIIMFSVIVGMGWKNKNSSLLGFFQPKKLRSDSYTIDIYQNSVTSTSSSISTPRSVVQAVTTNPMDISLLVKRSLTNQKKFDVLTNVWKPLWILNSQQHFNKSKTEWKQICFHTSGTFCTNEGNLRKYGNVAEKHKVQRA